MSQNEQMDDPEELRGVILGGNGILPLIDERTVGSVFAEAVLPLLPKLGAQLAVRYHEYNDFGSTTNPKIGMGWRPRDDVLLRATWGTSFRPPSFRELFDPVYEYIGFLFEDPWRCPVTESFEDCLGQEVEAVNVGNPQLQPDEGETRLVGLAWEPGWAPGLAFAIDLWEIEHESRVVYTGDGFSEVFDFFLRESPPDQNPYVIRADPSAEDIALDIPGPVTGIVSTYVNAGKVTTRGVDIEARYEWATEQAGDFSLGVNYAYLDEYFIGIEEAGASLKEDWAGAYADLGALPQNRGTLSASWLRGSHGLTLQYRYAGSYYSPFNLTFNDVEGRRSVRRYCRPRGP